MRMQVWSLAWLGGLRFQWIATSCGSDLALLQLWHRPADTALVWSLAWEFPYATGGSLKRKRKKKKKKTYIHISLFRILLFTIQILSTSIFMSDNHACCWFLATIGKVHLWDPALDTAWTSPHGLSLLKHTSQLSQCSVYVHHLTHVVSFLGKSLQLDGEVLSIFTAGEVIHQLGSKLKLPFPLGILPTRHHQKSSSSCPSSCVYFCKFH